MPTIPHDALVLVGDGGRALFFRNVGSPAKPRLEVEDVFENDNPATRDQGADQPGRAHASVGARRSAMEQTDWHRLAEEQFAGEIAGMLYRQAHRGGFERLVIVAPPKVLGDLRKSAHAEVADKIVAEIPKDLTSHPIPEIERALAA
ncbi:host attachment family protein [Terrarubrum flagellatum]|uniref:host attachment family protein n=1 Tax=Terrirubrum flagellatum TaxID=2895980 RepID=UPI00314560E0